MHVLCLHTAIRSTSASFLTQPAGYNATMPNRGRTHSAGKPAGGIKGDIPLNEGAIGPGVEKGAGGAMPADVENSSGRDDPRFDAHVKTQMPRNDGDVRNISDPNQATSQPMAGGGIGGTDEGRDRDVGNDVGSKDDLGGDERASGATMRQP